MPAGHKQQPTGARALCTYLLLCWPSSFFCLTRRQTVTGLPFSLPPSTSIAPTLFSFQKERTHMALSCQLLMHACVHTHTQACTPTRAPAPVQWGWGTPICPCRPHTKGPVAQLRLLYHPLRSTLLLSTPCDRKITHIRSLFIQQTSKGVYLIITRLFHFPKREPCR